MICTSDPERALWEGIAQEHIQEHKKTSAVQTTTAQGLAIKGILEQLDQKVLHAPANTPSKEIGHTLQVLSKQLASVAPRDAEVKKMHEEAKAKFTKALALVQQRVLDEGGVTKLQF